jgi:hypothetical protein
MDPTRLPEFCIRLTLPLGDGAEALRRAIQRAGGRDLGDGRFAFATERYGRIVLDEISNRLGAAFFEVIDCGAPIA